MIRIAALTLGLAIAALVRPTPAAALSYSDLLGQWCGDQSNQFLTNVYFTQDSFTTAWPRLNVDSKTRPIQRYEFIGATIKIHYIHERSGETWIMYGEFSRDGRRMSQLPTTSTPRYIFYRC